MYGLIGAYIFYYYKNFWNKYKIHCLIAGIILFILIKLNLLGFKFLGLYYSVFSFSLTSLSTLLLIPFLSSINTGKGFFYIFFTYISLISYSMYLINLTLVQGWIIDNINWSPIQEFNNTVFLVVRYLLYWALTIIISILLYKYFEIPVMNLRDKVKTK